MKISAELDKFEAMEVIGCDARSLMLYREEGDVFGVLPSQLVNHGYGATPTAVVMFQVDTMKLHGIWKIGGRQTVDQAQVCTYQSSFTAASLQLHCSFQAVSKQLCFQEP